MRALEIGRGFVRVLARVPPDLAATPWWHGVHVLALVGFGLRLAVALVSDSIHHPDEIFQYLEQGHRLAFGYGYVPWEFRFGIRSWLLPGFIAFLLSGCKGLGIDTPNAYVPFIKAVFCLLSVSAVYSAYAIGRNALSERAGRLAAFFVCIWYELLYLAQKPTPELLSTYALLGALALVLSRTPRSWAFGLLVAIGLVLRFQYFPIVGVLLAFALIVWSPRRLLECAAAFALIIVLTGWIDSVTWGGFLVSYRNSVLFNKQYNVAGLFGVRPVWYFVAALGIASGGLAWVPAGLLVRGFSRAWLPLGCAASLVLLHSLIPHKEYRFVIAAVPLLLVSLALLITGWDRAATLLGGALVPALFSIWSVLGAADHLPSEQKIYSRPIYAKQEILTAYRMLSEDSDVAGILNTFAEPAQTGGYYYLHRNVPVYTPAQLALSGLTADDALRAVSHVVCPADAPPFQGFGVVARIGSLEIRKRQPLARYQPLPVNNFELLFPGIDGAHQPTVRAFPAPAPARL